MATVSGARVLTSRRRVRYREWALAYLFVLPTIVGLVLFVLGPILYSAVMSFTNWKIAGTPVFIGLENYQEMFRSELFWRVARNTAYYTVMNVPASMLFGLAAALALNRKMRLTTTYRAFFFLPVVTSTVAIALVWGLLYNTDLGVINYLLSLVGIRGPSWIGSTAWAMPSIVIMSVWKSFGYSMVIFLAGLQGIPTELIEAAKIDGAGRWQAFRHVTFPLLSPTTFFVLIITAISSFQVFEATFILTDGGPAHATRTMALEIYQNAFRNYRLGFASAQSYFLFAAVLLVTAIQFRVQGKWTHYE
jgi:multiple sugar transport system permease protein